VTRGSYSWPVDLWALGCVLYELLTLQRPWNTASFMGLSAAILSGDIQAELLMATHHTTALKQLLTAQVKSSQLTAEHHRLLHVDPAERTNLAQLREALTRMQPAVATAEEHTQMQVRPASMQPAVATAEEHAEVRRASTTEAPAKTQPPATETVAESRPPATEGGEVLAERPSTTEDESRAANAA
jgi:serine/threonine protein kinase